MNTRRKRVSPKLSCVWTKKTDAQLRMMGRIHAQGCTDVAGEFRTYSQGGAEVESTCLRSLKGDGKECYPAKKLACDSWDFEVKATMWTHGHA